MKKLLTFGLLFFGVVSFGFAQSGSIQGTVTSQTGEVLPGANIYLVELERGASADIDGSYTITGVPFGTYTIRTTYVGYKSTQEQVPVDTETTTYNIQLNEDLIGLDEIVVTGLGGAALEKRRLSTTVETINSEQIEASPANNIAQVLQANLPNSQVRLSSGQPGTAPIIRGRGVVSALTSTTPVIYIDGVRVDNTTGFAIGIGTGGAQSSAIADIPIENIARVEVIKGGAATTLYGADAANGVIQIFTKKGVRGSPRITLETSLGSTVGTKDYLRYDETADILFEPGLYQKHQLTASGGIENVTYSFSGSLLDDEGFRPNNAQVRRNLRGTVSAEIFDWVKYTGSVGFANNEFQRDFNANTSFATFGELETGPGFFGRRALDELSSEELSQLGGIVENLQNAVDINSATNRFQTSHKLDFDIASGLAASTTVGLDSRATQGTNPLTNQFLIVLGAVPPGTTTQGTYTVFERDFLALTVEANATYQADFGDFSSVSVIGGQFFRDEDRQINVTATGVPDGITTINSGTDVNASDFQRSVANYGAYFQENFGYKNRYFIDFGLRVDQNSAFGEEIGPQTFPKVGASYSVSDEPFFKNNISSSAISTLKLRFTLGQAGNFPTPFANLALANIDPVLGNATIERGTDPGNDELKPEVITTLEVGANIGFVNDRISFEATYYDATTSDALFTINLPNSSGFTTQMVNIGEINNKGFEIAGNFVVLQKRDIGLRFNASVNTLDNVVVESGSPFAIGGFAFLGSFVAEGEPVGFLQGNDPVFADDGTIESIDVNANLGDPNPDLFGTLGVNFNYKGLTLNATADYQKGAQGVNVDEVLRFFDGLGDGRTRNGGSNFFNLAGVWVEDTDYIKVRSIGLNYRLPTTWYGNTLRSVDVGFNTINPFNFYSSNFDPEVTGAAIGTQNSVGTGGFGFATTSAPRQFIGNIKIGF